MADGTRREDRGGGAPRADHSTILSALVGRRRRRYFKRGPTVRWGLRHLGPQFTDNVVRRGSTPTRLKSEPRSFRLHTPPSFRSRVSNVMQDALTSRGEKGVYFSERLHKVAGVATVASMIAGNGGRVNSIFGSATHFLPPLYLVVTKQLPHFPQLQQLPLYNSNYPSSLGISRVASKIDSSSTSTFLRHALSQSLHITHPAASSLSF